MPSAPDAPLVSAIMLVSFPKRAEMIAQSCASFLWQDYPNLELVVVNDGDPLFPIEQRPGRTVSIVQVPKGLTIGEKRNAGVEAATGGLVASWDDDDISFPERISQQVRDRGQGPSASPCHRSSRMWIADRDLNIIGLLNDVCPATALLDRNAVLSVGGYPAISYLEDMELAYRFAIRGMPRTTSSDPVYVHRRHAANASNPYGQDRLVDNADRSVPTPQARLNALLSRPQRPILGSVVGNLMYPLMYRPAGQAQAPVAAPASNNLAGNPTDLSGGQVGNPTDRIVASIESAAQNLGPLLTGQVVPMLQRDKELQKTLGAAAGRAAAQELKPALWFIGGALAAGVFVYWRNSR